MDLELDQASVFVAASSKGLGRAIAERLAIEGADVTISSRSESNLEEAYDAITSNPAVAEEQVFPTVCDLSDRKSINNAIAATVERFGRLTGLVNNHGGPPAITFEDATENDWDEAYQNVIQSNIRLLNAGIPHLQDNGGGSIVTVTSASAREPGENHVLSNVFRLGLYGLTKSIAVEYAPTIRANCVTPRFVMTERIEYKIRRRAEHRGISIEEATQSRRDEVLLNRHGTPEEFGDAVAFMLSPRSSYTTGSIFSVDGGWSEHVL